MYIYIYIERDRRWLVFTSDIVRSFDRSIVFFTFCLEGKLFCERQANQSINQSLESMVSSMIPKLSFSKLVDDCREFIKANALWN